jgi:hypothetical protein
MTEPPIVRVLAEEVLWYSQRDGWGHLYRYDLGTGALLGQVTSGQWAVREILHVGQAERVVYFTASASTVDTPPVSRVRDWAGRVLAEREHADISKLTATGLAQPVSCSISRLIGK